jgi:hypothetical protein
MSATKPIRIAFNMLCCATLFFWAKPKPRETISGLFGRKVANAPFDLKMSRTMVRFWYAGERFINWLHWREIDHCFHTTVCENRARHELGYH